ncbi:MAG: hypothetical protein HY094_07715 [Candidatus Melainabacteria bacterium]|nr:hypothetical protein [Candidatus Melainabacteria bacterium]
MPVKLGTALLSGVIPFLAPYGNQKCPVGKVQEVKLEKTSTVNSPSDFLRFTYDEKTSKVLLTIAPENEIKAYFEKNKLEGFKDAIGECENEVKVYPIFTSYLKHVVLTLKDKTNEIIPNDRKILRPSLAESKAHSCLVVSQPFKQPPQGIICLEAPTNFVDIDSLAIRKYKGKDVLSFNMKRVWPKLDEKTRKVVEDVQEGTIVLPRDFHLVITKGDTAHFVINNSKKN